MAAVCVLCRRADADPDICGDKLDEHGLCAHVFCLLSASGLHLQPLEGEDAAFRQEDVEHVVEQAAQKECFICGNRGAAITCGEPGCDHSFHLPCGPQGACITQYFPPYSSFCWQHRPQQAVAAAPQQGTACLLCLEPVEDSTLYSTMVCPVCQHAWFHRRCIQAQAQRAAITCFQCPLCRDQEEFPLEMLTLGIQIPLRLPAWETSSAYDMLAERHSRCDASECLCAAGREWAEEEVGPWQLLLCSSCAAAGTHRRCSSLAESTASWECASCAGPTTATSASSEMASPHASSQEPSQGSPVLEGSSCSGSTGPGRGQKRSRSKRRAQNSPYSQPKRRRQSRRAPATTSQAPAEASCTSAVPRRSRRIFSRHSSRPAPVWVRVGSRLQRCEPNP